MCKLFDKKHPFSCICAVFVVTSDICLARYALNSPVATFASWSLYAKTNIIYQKHRYALLFSLLYALSNKFECTQTLNKIDISIIFDKIMFVYLRISNFCSTVAACFRKTQRHIAQSSLNHHLRNELIIKIGTAPYGRRLPVFDDGLW